jgi:hypothetical protein
MTDWTNRLGSQCTFKDGLPISHAFYSKGNVLDGLLALVPSGTALFRLGAARVPVLYGLAGGFDGDV